MPFVGSPYQPVQTTDSPIAFAVSSYAEAPYATTLDDLTAPVPGSSEAHAYIYESVQISLQVSGATMYIYENVGDFGAPKPVIWFINPTQANPGDTVFIVGTGLGAFQETYNGEIIFGSLIPLPNLWEYVGPSPNAYTSQRQIVPSQNLCDPEHELLSFTVPQGASSGLVKVSTST